MHASNVPRTTDKDGSFISVLLFVSVNFWTAATVGVYMHAEEKERKKLHGNCSTAGCTGAEALVYLQFCLSMAPPMTSIES